VLKSKPRPFAACKFYLLLAGSLNKFFSTAYSSTSWAKLRSACSLISTLEVANGKCRLKKLVADLSLDNAILSGNRSNLAFTGRHLSSAWSFGSKLGQDFGMIAAFEAANGKSRFNRKQSRQSVRWGLHRKQ